MSTTAKELLPLIRSKGKDDKYSENLCKWVKKWAKQRGNRELTAAFLHWSSLDGSHVDMIHGTTQMQQFLLGYYDDDGWFYGARLSSIVGGAAEVYAFPLSFKTTPLPDWFDGYVAGGKCFIDPEHRYYCERWQVAKNGKTRVCEWCGGVTQRKTIHRKVVKETRWVAL